MGYPLVGSKVKIIMQYIMRFEGKSFKTEISEPTVSKSNHYKWNISQATTSRKRPPLEMLVYNFELF